MRLGGSSDMKIPGVCENWSLACYRSFPCVCMMVVVHELTRYQSIISSDSFLDCLFQFGCDFAKII